MKDCRLGAEPTTAAGGLFPLHMGRLLKPPGYPAAQAGTLKHIQYFNTTPFCGQSAHSQHYWGLKFHHEKQWTAR